MAKLRPKGRAKVIAAFIAAAASVVVALIGVARWERGTEGAAGDGPTYRGIVLDEGTRATIAGVRVSVDAVPVPRVAYTDNEGSFVISVPADSVDTEVRMRFLMKGYQPYDRVVTPAGGRLEEIRLVRTR